MDSILVGAHCPNSCWTSLRSGICHGGWEGLDMGHTHEEDETADSHHTHTH